MISEVLELSLQKWANLSIYLDIFCGLVFIYSEKFFQHMIGLRFKIFSIIFNLIFFLLFLSIFITFWMKTTFKTLKKSVFKKKFHNFWKFSIFGSLFDFILHIIHIWNWQKIKFHSFWCSFPNSRHLRTEMPEIRVFLCQKMQFWPFLGWLFLLSTHFLENTNFVAETVNEGF